MKLKRSILLTIIAGLTSIILSLLGNIVITILFSTSPPPTIIAPYVQYIPFVFGIVAFISIILSVALLPSENASTSSLHNVSPQTGNNEPMPTITFPCPICKHNTLHVHGRTGNDLILICSTCSKITRLTYNGSVVEKLVVPGLILIGTIEILQYLDANPTDLLDLFSNFFFKIDV